MAPLAAVKQRPGVGVTWTQQPGEESGISIALIQECGLLIGELEE